MLVTGMIIGTMFTLFIVPSIYMLVAKTRTTLSADRQRRDVHVPELAEAV
jgi:multidrug efflux pump